MRGGQWVPTRNRDDRHRFLACLSGRFRIRWASERANEGANERASEHLKRASKQAYNEGRKAFVIDKGRRGV